MALLQKVLQLYARQQLGAPQQGGSSSGGASEALVDELLAADESLWERLMRQRASEGSVRCAGLGLGRRGMLGTAGDWGRRWTGRRAGRRAGLSLVQPACRLPLQSPPPPPYTQTNGTRGRWICPESTHTHCPTHPRSTPPSLQPSVASLPSRRHCSGAWRLLCWACPPAPTRSGCRQNT